MATIGVTTATVYALKNYKGHDELIKYLIPLLDDEEFKKYGLITNVKKPLKNFPQNSQTLRKDKRIIFTFIL